MKIMSIITRFYKKVEHNEQWIIPQNQQKIEHSKQARGVNWKAWTKMEAKQIQ